MFTTPRAHLAHWLTQSFTILHMVKNGKIKALFLGVHEPRNPKRAETADLEDLKPKINLSVLDGRAESIPFPAHYMPKIIGGLNALFPTRDLWSIAKKDAAIMRSESETPRFIDYVERDFRKFTNTNIMKIAERNGIIMNYSYDDPAHKSERIQWLRKCYVFYQRKREKTGTIVDQFISIGKDTKYDCPVIGFRKSWDNYITIIPLVDPLPLRIITMFAYFVYYPPYDKLGRIVPFVNPETFERDVSAARLEFRDAPLIQLDFFQDSLTKIIAKLG